MGYQQGTGNLQRSITTAAVTLGSSNGAASVTTVGTRFTLTVTLSAALANSANGGPITINNSSIKASSVIDASLGENLLLIPYQIFAVEDGSCKFQFINIYLEVADTTAIKWNFMIYN